MEQTHKSLSVPFDWLMTVATTWFIGGVYLDGWAHNNIPSLESFFTPWHAVLYSGFFVTALCLIGKVVLNRKTARSLNEAIPQGYRHSLFGVGLFLVSGVGDLIWHTLFGIEKSTEALLSPTHIGLAVGAFLIYSGPFVAGALRAKAKQMSLTLPMLLSLIYCFSAITFMTQFATFAHLLNIGIKPATTDLQSIYDGLSVSSFLFQVTWIAGIFLTAMRRFRLPFGSFTLVLLLNTIGMTIMKTSTWLIPAALIAGLLIDGLVYLLKPISTVTRFRVFATLFPAIFFICYLTSVTMTGQLWWSIHMWTGSVVVPAVMGLLMSLVIWPPKVLSVNGE